MTFVLSNIQSWPYNAGSSAILLSIQRLAVSLKAERPCLLPLGDTLYQTPDLAIRSDSEIHIISYFSVCITIMSCSQALQMLKTRVIYVAVKVFITPARYLLLLDPFPSISPFPLTRIVPLLSQQFSTAQNEDMDNNVANR
jgi:hypothetical protein